MNRYLLYIETDGTLNWDRYGTTSFGKPAASSWLNINCAYICKDYDEGDADLPASEVDWIVEQGTSGGWVYRKWNSGVAECWISHTVTVSVTSAWGNLYAGVLTPPNYPSGLFLSAPALFHTSEGDTGYLSFSASQSKSSTTAPSQVSLLRGTSAGSSQTYTTNFHAIGRWK